MADWQQTAGPDAAGLVYQLGTGLQQRQAALQLVYRAYLARGLIHPNPWQIRVTPHHLLPTTYLFIASKDGQVVCCLTLVADGVLGLPMEESFPLEVARRRAAARPLAEVTCLADDGGPRRFRAVMNLMSFMAQFARRNGIEELLVAVHPRHSRLYRSTMAFQLLGEPRSCPRVRGRPAVALRLDLARAPVDHPEAYHRFFDVPFPDRQLEPRPIPDEQQAYFRQFLQPVEETNKRRAA